MIWSNVELYSGISYDLAEKVEKGLDIAQKVVDSKNLVTTDKTIGKKFDTVDNLIGKVAKNKGIINAIDTAGDTVGVVGGIFGGVTDIPRLAQDQNSAPWDYVGAGVKVAKNITDKILVLCIIMHITDFTFNSVNEAVEMAKKKRFKLCRLPTPYLVRSYGCFDFYPWCLSITLLYRIMYGFFLTRHV
jgi:hypothetical protein